MTWSTCRNHLLHPHLEDSRMARQDRNTKDTESGNPKRRSEAADVDGKRTYVSQADVPAYSLEKALRIPQAIADNYGKNPTRPLRIAEALNMLPSSSTFRMLTGAATAYGLT